LDLTAVADIGLQLLHACEYMHSKQVIHTDIKSENILLAAGPEGSYTIKLVDMGSSLFTSWWHPPIIGTMEYRAPETLLQVGSLLAHPGLPPLFCKFLAQQRWAISMICERRPHHACF
jgi:serine/threonine protein kinase